MTGPCALGEAPAPPVCVLGAGWARRAAVLRTLRAANTCQPSSTNHVCLVYVLR